MIYDIFSSQLGDILVVRDEEKIVIFGFVDQKYMKKIPNEWQKTPSDKLLLNAKRQTAEYFSGKRKTFDLPLSPQGTLFQRSVWEALETIPYGEVTNYGKLAAQIGKPKAVRAVGTAIGRNPIGIIIPCHRVIGANKTLTGYAGGIPRKQSLLELEGFTINKNTFVANEIF